MKTEIQINYQGSKTTWYLALNKYCTECGEKNTSWIYIVEEHGMGYTSPGVVKLCSACKQVILGKKFVSTDWLISIIKQLNVI